MSKRTISTLVLGFVIFSCNTKKSIMTKEEFAKVYMDSLSKKFPMAKFELTSDLTITSKKGDLEYRHYVDNAFTAYQAEPDSVKSIIGRYAASASELYLGKKETDLRSIVPVIKPVEYLDEVNSLGKEGAAPSIVTEKYNDQLIIAYAVDSKNSISFLTEDEFKKLSISKDTLRAIALRNFDEIMTKIKRDGDNGLYMITAGGDYEASLILLSSLWTKDNFPVDGDFIIGIPNRDILLITGSRNRTGIDKIKKFVADSYKTGNYQISNRLYKWTGEKFEVYE